MCGMTGWHAICKRAIMHHKMWSVAAPSVDKPRAQQWPNHFHGHWPYRLSALSKLAFNVCKRIHTTACNKNIARKLTFTFGLRASKSCHCSVNSTSLRSQACSSTWISSPDLNMLDTDGLFPGCSRMNLCNSRMISIEATKLVE